MRIFLNGHNSRSGGGVNVGQNLLRSLSRVASHHEYFMTIPEGFGFEPLCAMFPKMQTVAYRVTDHFSHWRWDTFHLPQLIRDFRPDVLFNLANRGVVSPPCAQATYIQDSHFYFPENRYGPLSRKQRWIFRYYRYHLRKTLKTTQMLFCQTRTGQRLLREIYGPTPEVRLCPSVPPMDEVIPDSELRMPDSLMPFRDRFRLFYPSPYAPHKNFELMLELFRKYREELQDVLLVLTVDRNQSSGSAWLMDQIQRDGLESHILTTGTLDRRQVQTYYHHTHALLMTSFMETIGLPYLEAMKLRRLILTSELDFAHDACGDAAAYFDPWDVDSLFQTLQRLRRDTEWQQRLLQAGEQQLRSFFSMSWDDVASGLIRDLESLVSRE